jgi:hypothetical protein
MTFVFISYEPMIYFFHTTIIAKSWLVKFVMMRQTITMSRQEVVIKTKKHNQRQETIAWNQKVVGEGKYQ